MLPSAEARISLVFGAMQPPVRRGLHAFHGGRLSRVYRHTRDRAFPRFQSDTHVIGNALSNAHRFRCIKVQVIFTDALLISFAPIL